jgi:SAM-dependent methyltransferase
LHGSSNLAMVRGEASDPRLPAAAVDAILVANTFHELEDPDAILVRAREALRPGGRLVIVDPDADADDARRPDWRPWRDSNPRSPP